MSFVVDERGRGKPDVVAVGQRLTRLREEAGMTQPDVAVKTGLAPITVWRAERGLFSFVTLNRLHKSFGWSLDYILYGEDAP